MILRFGKYKDRDLSEVPEHYLTWLLKECRNLSPTMRAEINRLLSGAVVPTEDIVTKWYRRLAREFHPDLGGSHEAMKAVNRGRELMIELLKQGK